jgi:hypothetical protein
MRFAPNRMYVEAYHKCANCGLLLYEKPAQAGSTMLARNGVVYCSEWCIAWEAARAQRLRAEAVPPA